MLEKKFLPESVWENVSGLLDSIGTYFADAF